jgi:hypothetical protein
MSVVSGLQQTDGTFPVKAVLLSKKRVHLNPFFCVNQPFPEAGLARIASIKGYIRIIDTANTAVT